jgi:hypothetical protein
VQTNPTKTNNKPGIIIHGNEEGMCVLIDAPISGNRNMIKKVVVIILKGKYRIIEI